MQSNQSQTSVVTDRIFTMLSVLF